MGNVEMSGLHCSLSHVVGYQEEIELAVDDFGLFNESLVNVSTLGWVFEFFGLSVKEALSDSLVDNNQSDDWRRDGIACVCAIFVGDYDLELLKFVIYNLLPHGVAYSISVNENVIRHAFVVLFVSLESTVEILLQNA